MKKLTALVLVALIVATSASAVDFMVGPKVTVGDYSYRGSDWKDWKDFVGIKDKLSFSFSGGVFANLQLTSMIGVQVEGLFTRASFRYGDSSSWVQYSNYAIGVPVYARFDYDLGDYGVYVLAGPRVDILFDKVKAKDSTGATATLSLKDDQGYDKLFVIGAAIGAGVSVPAGSGVLDFGVGFNTGLTKVMDDYKGYPYSFDIQIAYGIGI